MKPIFIFSLPRSGSTLLQRILGSDKRIATISEPWLLLPLVYSFRKFGSFTEYSHLSCWNAHQEIFRILESKNANLYRLIRNYCMSIYQNLAENESYFLDKTPRYYLILPEIAKIFPDGKFIFLFRNPAAIFSSVINTWCKGRLYFPKNYIDLFEGPFLLRDGYLKMCDNSLMINYEDLILKPEDIIGDIYSYLELSNDNKVLEFFSETRLNGILGDKKGENEKNIENKNIHAWKNWYQSRYRKRFINKYLNNLGPELLDTMGYNLNDILSQINKVPNHSTYGYLDWIYFVITKFLQKNELHCLYIKRKALFKGEHKAYWLS